MGFRVIKPDMRKYQAYRFQCGIGTEKGRQVNTGGHIFDRVKIFQYSGYTPISLPGPLPGLFAILVHNQEMKDGKSFLLGLALSRVREGIPVAHDKAHHQCDGHCRDECILKNDGDDQGNGNRTPE